MALFSLFPVLFKNMFSLHRVMYECGLFCVVFFFSFIFFLNVLVMNTVNFKLNCTISYLFSSPVSGVQYRHFFF